MPNYYAHQVFGRQVLALLPQPLRDRVEEQSHAFLLGLYGPDPLFFAHPIRKAGPRRLAQAMHRQSAYPEAQALLEAVTADRPDAAGYAAGFLCHFALDSRCHSYIEACQHQGLSHSAMEAELDRALMLQDGLDPLHDTPLPRLSPSPALLSTIVSTLYPSLTEAEFAHGLRCFARMCRVQTRLGGSRANRAADWLGSRSRRLSPLQGCVLPPQPDPRYAGTTQTLLTLLNAETTPTAQALVRFFAAAEGYGSLDSWFDRPFTPKSQAAAYAAVSG